MSQRVDTPVRGGSLKERLDGYERELILAALRATAGNQRQAAFRLGVLPTTLHEKMKRLGVVLVSSRPTPMVVVNGPLAAETADAT
jgi:DNA-binding NtrC family response regulator